MPTIRVVMPNGTTRPFREGTPKSVIRRAIADMLADMKASGRYDDFDFSAFEKSVGPPRVVVTQSRPNTQQPRLGDLSMIYETGKPPGQESAAAGTVSTDINDPGGISYGAYQLSSKKGVLQDFLQHEGQPWAGQFSEVDTMRPDAARSIWHAIATTEGDDFFRAQHDYIKRSHYDPVVAAVRKTTGLDFDTQSDPVRQAVWSVAVQHGGAPGILDNAVNSLSGKISPADPMYQQALVKAIYQARRDYVTNLNDPEVKKRLPGMLNRYNKEEADALGMFGSGP